jgi:ADP-dependent NAD(P)H-hydrate dehydratase / NAD(P)H-hydrate epimerase
MIPLYTTAEIRALEHAHAHPQADGAGKKTPRGTRATASLMQRAGEAVAACAIEHIATHKLRKSVIVIAGPGNNGGDAWVAARALQKKKVNVTVWNVGSTSAENLTSNEDAAIRAHQEYRASSGKIVSKIPPNKDFSIVIDGIFGIGLKRPPEGVFRDAIRFANDAHAGGTTVLAIDIPSGLDADTGVAYADCVTADITLTFLGAKPGLYTADGRDHCGEIRIDTLGVSSTAENGDTPRGHVLSEAHCAGLIRARRHNSHKGSYGNVGIIGGADGMTGAAVLAARAALHMGPGKVYAGLLARDGIVFDAINPEIMMRAASEVAEDAGITAFAIGMGAGDGKPVKTLLSLVLASNKPTVIDADALAFVHIDDAGTASSGENNNRKSFSSKSFEAKTPESARQYSTLSSDIVLTPHPGEAARLLGTTAAAIQNNRVEAACQIAKRATAIVVLKGAGTIIATPRGDYFINPTGNPGMASGGMGDALAGMIAAFMSQGLAPPHAAQLAVYLHGAAADAACHHGMGPHGLTASEVIFEARTLLNSCLHDPHD